MAKLNGKRRGDLYDSEELNATDYPSIAEFLGELDHWRVVPKMSPEASSTDAFGTFE